MDKVYDIVSTGWGYVIAVWSKLGLWELTFPQPDDRLALASVETPGIVAGGDTAASRQLARELSRYFAGERVAFTTAIDWSGYTAFRVEVLKFTAQIPYGEVATYGGVAAAIGAPRAGRAVGGALHINRTPVIIPCHRVVGAGGKLTGFGGGLDLKKALLALESICDPAGQNSYCRSTGQKI